jgi:peptidoglycan/LPS O-acetylase OafA/YrhL
MKNIENSKHNSGIDALRGFAILSVILLHINIRIPFSDTYFGSILPHSIYNILFWSGFYGVCVFFVISGFLITTSSLNKWDSLPNLSLSGFYSMRFARIMPLLLALLLVLSLFHFFGIKEFVINPEKTTLGRAIFAALTFHINWLEIKVGYLPGSWDVLWSLSIEEIFYLFFPIVCILCRKEWHFIALISVFLVISPFARTVWYSGNELGDKNHFAFLDAISLGCMAAIFAKNVIVRKSLLNTMAIIGWGLMSLILLFRSFARDLHLWETGLNVTFLAIGTALVLIWMQKRLVSGKQVPSKFTGALRFLGRNSYEVYLTHMFVVFLFVRLYLVLNLSGEWAWLLYVVIVILSGVLGALVAKYFSNPLNVFLRKKFTSKKMSAEVLPL